MTKIMGHYKGRPVEEIDVFDTEEEAEKMLGEYQLAYDADWELWLEDK